MFGSHYAGAYDAIYRHKDYAGEVALVERILASKGLTGPRRLLDLGCGTGNHALPLAEHGHTVVGIDRSPAMLEQARAKSVVGLSGSIAFVEADIRKLDLPERFDAVLMMFTVLGYQLEDADVTAALRTVRRHLDPGGLFIFDIWYGPAVLAEGPGARSVTVEEDAVRISRNSRSTLDRERHLCRVYFDLERIETGGRSERWQEEHVVRFYFADELKLALAQNQLELLDLRSFPDGETAADERTWNVIGTARAR